MMSSSSSSATVRVEKATSDLLIGPDWTMNMDICDSINSSHWDAKDVIKAVKKRLQHKNPKVQLLALTLLETMVKNCGDYVHFQITEKNILQEMIKIVKKKTDMQVRYKILVLIDSWQEAFGGRGGKYPQYFWAYEELRRSGAVFPQRSLDAAPIFTPPVTRSTLRHAQPGHGMPSNSSKRLDEAMAAEIENLSLSSINSMRNVLDLLADMLQAVNPSDLVSVKDEVIVDLVNTCRSNQKKLMQMLTTTGDEELLGQGLELNDNLQSVLAKHDAIISGSPLPIQATNFNDQSDDASGSSLKPTEVNEPSQAPIANLSASVVATTKGQVDEEEDEEDDFALLARRHSKTRSTSSQDTSTDTTSNGGLSAIPAESAPIPSNALALPDPPASVRTTKNQAMIEDLFSITLSTPTTTGCPRTPHTPAASSQNIHQAPVSPTTQGYPYTSQTYSGNQGQVPLNSYVVPWAQPQSKPQVQPQIQPQYPQRSPGYIPPPGAAMEEQLGVAPAPSGARVRHIKKRALKNKALSVSFDEKDLRDYVTGFHKRKKKRRKEAHQKLEEAHRRKRIEARKKRKLEREFVLYGGAPGGMGAGSDEGGDNSEQDEESEPIPSVSVEGTTLYDTGDMRITVTTCEISHEEEGPSGGPQAATHRSIVGDVKKHHNLPVIKKKPFKRVVNKSRKKPQNKRDRSKGKKKNKKH